MDEYLRANPVAYAGYRIIYLYKENGVISESTEVPFLKSPIFAIVLTIYLMYSRIKGIILNTFGKVDDLELPSDTHIFTMTDPAAYRTNTFLDVAKELQTRGFSVHLLCSPSVEVKIDEFQKTGFSTTTHRELHREFRAHRIFKYIVLSYKHTKTLVQFFDSLPLMVEIQIFNSILLEYIKSDSIDELVSGQPVIHTFAPMPYILQKTTNDRIFVYQHGIQLPSGDILTSAPFFIPLTYLMWGDTWVDIINEYVHDESRIYSVGSPWHDSLAGQTWTDSPSIDILFISGSHGISPGNEEEYEKLVWNLINFSDNREMDLAIKLHPLESRSWYKNRGWEGYIVEYDDIDHAVRDARIAVTDCSSAFVESSLLGTPVIIADIHDSGLKKLAPIDGVVFLRELSDIQDILDKFFGGELDPWGKNSDEIVRTGNSTERIVEIIVSQMDTN